jgi:hypothetical protein
VEFDQFPQVEKNNRHFQRFRDEWGGFTLIHVAQTFASKDLRVKLFFPEKGFHCVKMT